MQIRWGPCLLGTYHGSRVSPPFGRRRLATSAVAVTGAHVVAAEASAKRRFSRLASRTCARESWKRNKRRCPKGSLTPRLSPCSNHFASSYGQPDEAAAREHAAAISLNKAYSGVCVCVCVCVGALIPDLPLAASGRACFVTLGPA